MRRTALAIILAALPATTFAATGTLPVPMNEAVRISLPTPARDVIVGNPEIADVTVTDGRHLIVTGKGFGQTNLIVTGQKGQTLVNEEVLVPPPMAGQVTMITGAAVQNYACAPQCAATDESKTSGGGDLFSRMLGAMAGAKPQATSQ
jgi:Flp pilus assembly secretin CpaC